MVGGELSGCLVVVHNNILNATFSVTNEVHIILIIDSTEELASLEGHGAAILHTLHPTLGQIIAETLNIDIVAVEANLHVSAVVFVNRFLIIVEREFFR